MGADALLARNHQMIAEQPLMQRNLGGFKDGANGDAVLLAAVAALDDTSADCAFRMGLGFAATLGRQALCIEGAAMRAERASGPTQRFKMLAGFVLVGEVGSGK